MSVRIIRGDALHLPLADATVDLVVTSPPYFGLRSYQDGGEHYEGQIGSEPTPAEFVDALIAATREMVRVLKPSGSIWVNLGDKYASTSTPGPQSSSTTMTGGAHKGVSNIMPRTLGTDGVRMKSLMGIPWRYAIRCIDDLGLILRAEVIWSKPNGLPESVTDRVRRSHEQWFHFTNEPRYFSAVDEIREPHLAPTRAPGRNAMGGRDASLPRTATGEWDAPNPLGKLPGSVWTVPTEPLRVPDHLGVDHFAAFPTEFPRRIIAGWSPAGVCVECGEGRRPVVDKQLEVNHVQRRTRGRQDLHDDGSGRKAESSFGITERSVVGSYRTTVTGYACACPEPTAPATPAVVLDPFGGTGTTALVADVLGRDGISVDMSADYCRLAQWRTSDPIQRARAARVAPVDPIPDGQLALFEETA